jgi:hypothetical protein
MYTVNIVVKWTNGDHEGFGASALTAKHARERAINKAYRKSGFLTNPGFDVLSKAEYDALPIETQDEIQSDWDQELL